MININTILSQELDGNSRKFMFLDDYNNKWMCKFDKKRGSQIMHDSVSEHISCKIMKSLGYYVQDTELYNYYGEDCVLCKVDYNIEPLKMIQSYLTEEKLIYDIDTLLEYTKKKPNIDLDEFKKQLVERLPLDCVLINIDLHAGNIGLFRDNSNILKPSYIYDLGGSLLSKYALEDAGYLSKALSIKETVRFGKRNINMKQFIKEHNLGRLVKEKYVLFMYNKKKIEEELKQNAPNYYHKFIENSLKVVEERFKLFTN